MLQNINRESSRNPNTIIYTPNTEKQEHSNGNESQRNNNRITTHQKHPEQTQTQKEEIKHFKEN